MPCICPNCHDHARTLGLARLPASRKAIHRAYRNAAKLCHPDRFAGDQAKILDAEERFKTLQAAYRELNEHNPEEIEAAEETPGPPGPGIQSDSDSNAGWGPNWKPTWNPTSTPAWNPASNPSSAPTPFGSAPGCYSVSNFPPRAQTVVSTHLGLYDYAVGIVDLSGDGSFNRFLLLASHGVILKDAAGTISMLRYDDLGKMEILNREDAGRIPFWEKIAGELTGIKHKLALDIFRRSGKPFCSLTGQIDDAAKVAIYQYLSRTKRKHKA